MHDKTRRQALTEGVVAGVLFGTAAVFVRYLPGLNSFSIVFWRLIIACGILASILVVLRKSFQQDLISKNLKDLLILGAFLGFHFTFFTFSVKDTTILNATVLVNTTPIFSTVVSALFFKIKPSRFTLVGLVVSFAGVFLIAYSEIALQQVAKDGTFPTLRGDSEALLAAIVEAFYLNYGRKIRKQMNILSIMLPVYAFTAITVGILSFAAGNMLSPLSYSAETVVILLGIGLLPTAIAHTLYFSSLSHLRSFETATLALFEPFGATILGIAAFHEIPGVVFVIGAGLVLTGIFFTLGKLG